MAVPISAMEAIEIVRKAVVLYQKIRNAPEEIAAVGRRIEDLEFYLAELQALVNDKRRHALANLRPQQTQRLRKIIGDIRVDADDVYEILKIWESAGSISRVFFTVGRNPRRLEDLTGSMEQRKQDLRDILQLMGIFGLQAQHHVQRAPSPARTRTDYGITFIDPNNLGRSKVAEGYTKLLREWTVRTGGQWRIKFAHSAGMRVRDKSDCVDILQNLKRPIPISNGNRSPNETAMASLFDNNYFDFPYKADVKNTTTTSRSRGLTQNIFKTYDFILVFVGREYENLLLFKEALVKSKGESFAPPGKGRIIHLGAYLAKDGKPVEIVDAPKNKDDTDSRANWNATTSQIKLAVKAFLKNELGWVQPSKGLQGS